MDYRFITVDVFAAKRFEGAQIAIIPEAKALTSEKMQQIASEFNLWRTVFLIPSDKEGIECSIRIFNHKQEFDFGGHATIAAIYAMSILQLLTVTDGQNEFVISENHGDVDCMVEVNQGQVQFSQFTSRTAIGVDRFTPEIDELAKILSVDPSKIQSNDLRPLLVSSHLPYLFVPVDSVDSLKEVAFDYKAWTASTAPSTFANAIFVFSESKDKTGSHFHCRLVGPSFGLHEDPPIGAAMPAFSGYLSEFERAKSQPYHFVAERGVHAGRKSTLNVDLIERSEKAVTVKIGGKAILVTEGKIHL